MRTYFGLLALLAAHAPDGPSGGAALAGERGEGVKVGQRAPDFNATASDGKLYTLGALAGKLVVLYFYPKDDTPGCTIEAKGFRDVNAEFAGLGAIVLGVSRDGLDSHQAFAHEYGLNFPLLADPEGVMHQAFGAFKQGSLWGKTALGVDRSTVVIDGYGVVRKVWRQVKPDGHAEEVLAFVKGLAAPR